MRKASPDKLRSAVEAHIEQMADEIAALAQTLVRIPSVNHPPLGDEAACQAFVAKHLAGMDLNVDTYSLDEVDGLKNHPAWEPGRDYHNRPNVSARRPGRGLGRSLVLSGHIDTVPLGTRPWQEDPFLGTIRGGRLYGLGACDMKGGVAAALFAMQVVQTMDLPLAGDLIVETVVDEEFGGVNGTLAGRVRGYVGDAMIITEPSCLAIWNGDRGGRTAHVTLSAEEGIGLGGDISANVIDQLSVFLTALDRFRRQRRSHVPNWDSLDRDPIPVWVTKVSSGGWGYDVPITVPAECRIELYWQLEPGETQTEVDSEFFSWLKDLTEGFPQLFPLPPRVEFPIRWMPGSIVPGGNALVSEFREVVEVILQHPVPIELADGPSDLFVVNQYFPGPAIMFGPRGGNAHAADEYLLVEDLVTVTKVLTLFAMNWCGLEGA